VKCFANLRSLPYWAKRSLRSFLSWQTFRDGSFAGNGRMCFGQFLRSWLILWLLGVVSFYSVGGFVVLLLIVAVDVLLIRVIEGRRPLV
jgi:hypothetical protein